MIPKARSHKSLMRNESVDPVVDADNPDLSLDFVADILIAKKQIPEPFYFSDETNGKNNM